MNVVEQARTAYAPGQYHLKSARAVEAQLFAEVTSRLKRAQQFDQSFKKLVDAVHANRAMWITLSVDIASDDNNLPELLKSQLISLASFVTDHSAKVLRKEADLAVLIDINASILTGLNTGEYG